MFACTRCGACCRVAAAVPELAAFTRDDGSCMHLRVGSDGLHSCAIYDSRPTVCRVDESCPSVMELDEWHRRNVDACGRLHLEVYGQPLARRRSLEVFTKGHGPEPADVISVVMKVTG